MRSVFTFQRQPITNAEMYYTSPSREDKVEFPVFLLNSF